MQEISVRNTAANFHECVRWENDEDHPAIIIDGKIEFKIKELDVILCLHVKGTKGLGAADADKLVDLSPKHYYIIRVMKKIHEQAKEGATSEAILNFASHMWQGETKFKTNPYKRTISELFRRKILTSTKSKPPIYSLNIEAADRAVESGKFEPNK